MGRRRARRNSAAIRKALANELRSRIKAAEQLLHKAQSAAGLSANELQAAGNELQQAKAAIDAAKQEELAARQQLREIEEDILAEQGSDSELSQAQTAVDQALQASEQEFYRVTEIAPDSIPAGQSYQVTLNSLEPYQMSQLEADPDYQTARANFKAAVAKRDHVRQQLLHQDSEWQAAQAELQAAKSEVVDAQRSGVAAGKDGLVAKTQFRNASELTQYCQQFLQVAHVQLRQLGG